MLIKWITIIVDNADNKNVDKQETQRPIKKPNNLMLTPNSVGPSR